VIDGYSADCVVFGSGGALLQKVNRDTYKFAQKASAILVEDENGKEYWKGIAKDPVTDAGKKSKEGVLTLVRSKMNNELMPARLDQGPLDSEWEDIMQLVYFKGQLYNETTLAEVRARAA
jgi:nicotinamide phosphoribosyltransferase